MLGFKNLKNLIFTSYAQKQKKDKTIYSHKISLDDISLDDFLINKITLLEPLSELIEYFNDIVIKPNQFFSFSKAIANSNSYDSVFIHLLSSLIYQLALTCSIDIKERHHFQYDLYSDNNRLFPLGAEADISYGSKDLRLKNNYPFPLKLKIKLLNNKITGEFISKEKITSSEVNYKKIVHKNYIEIFTRVNKRTVAVSMYKLNIDQKGLN